MNLDAKVDTKFPIPHPCPGNSQRYLGRLWDFAEDVQAYFLNLNLKRPGVSG